MFVKSNENEYLIWSVGHNAWWKGGEFGYTTDRTNAGIYTFDKAIEICKRANFALTNEEKPNEAMVPVY